jgi:DNA-binding LacI/PurR family transcriptional regulator
VAVERSKRSRTPANGKRSVSIRDVAAAAGVSVATVSRALSADADSVQIRPETRQRVLQTSQELGYRPNDLARALLHQRTSVIGLVVPDISNSYYAGLVRGVEDTASAGGYRVVLCNTDREMDKLSQYLDALVKSRVDGVIIAGGGADSSIDPRVFRQYRTKTVLVGRHGLSYPSVQIDNVAAAEEITNHLLDLGHERVAFLAGPLSSHTVQDRLQGYCNALAARGIRHDDELVREGDLDEESGYRGADELVHSSSRPTAIICTNDRIAVGALAALTDSGLKVPEQMSVAGFDDVSISSYLRPRLTTVAIPTYEIGASAAALLLDELQPEGTDDAEQTANEVLLLPTHLVVRDSSAPPSKTRAQPRTRSK